ncbi:D-alanine--D-alanine ligase family protein [Corynebacterium otitidis]|uniref:D-alanine--D-alanine ligase n=1 Tax=Corynebacterium otitidis ATCC 51513 TaxID=883169 RepID=I7JW04_9CORY|nr:D-alanine--D-alanine ligase family protein [Corynebacterium otitidis]EJZ82300.1 D-alanine-D-alanine ligase [Corynebacterium otitidis ATCC 51513]CCI83426.1 D-alanyl-alanine synthetase A [Corynebacterium otitidis ATCC 51513]
MATPGTKKITVAVVYGGRSGEHSISCLSAGAVMDNLDRERFEVVPVGITRHGDWVPGTTNREELSIVEGRFPEVAPGERLSLSLSPTEAGTFRLPGGEVWAKADVIFPVLHGRFGEDGAIQGLFELSGVPYVGTGVLSAACGMDKEFTKKIATAAGVPATPEAVLRAGEGLSDADRERLGLPVFVKPASGGSSIGISRVERWEDLPAALEEARASDPKVIVEAAVEGAEVELGVLEHPDGRLEASVPARLLGTGESEEGFYGFEAKYVDDVVSAEVPADYPAPVVQDLQRLALQTFEALGCEGLARVDFFLTEEGPLFNEINTMPGFTEISMYPKVFEASGTPYRELLATLVETALRRAEDRAD